MNLQSPKKDAIMSSLSLQRYETNPFLELMTIPMKGKRIQVSRLGRDDNVLVNQNTGEKFGTHVTTLSVWIVSNLLNCLLRILG